MSAAIITPDEYVGDVSSDLTKRRGKVEDVESMIGYQAVRAKVPLSEMFGYVTSLRTITSGRATSNLEFSHYDVTPMDITNDVIYKIKGYLVNS